VAHINHVLVKPSVRHSMPTNKAANSSGQVYLVSHGYTYVCTRILRRLSLSLSFSHPLFYCVYLRFVMCNAPSLITVHLCHHLIIQLHLITLSLSNFCIQHDSIHNSQPVMPTTVG